MKYLVPIKMKAALVASEEGNIFGITRIIAQNHSLLSNEEQIAYILCDNELIVQNFTPNAPKLLSLDSSAINNNLDVTDFIKEFNDEFYKELDKYEDIKESNWKVIKKIKIELVKKLFNDPDVRKLVTWKLGDLININNDHALINYKNMKIMRTLKTNFGNKSHIDPRKNQSSFADNTGRAFKLQSKVSHKKNMSAYEENFYNKNISSEIKKDFG